MERIKKLCPQDCLWFEQCGNMNRCTNYVPFVDDNDLSDAELERRRIAFRKEYFEYAKKNELYDEERTCKKNILSWTY